MNEELRNIHVTTRGGVAGYAGFMGIGYMGPRDTNDFDELSADVAVARMSAYRLLGEAFEQDDEDEMLGRGWLLEDPLELVQGKAGGLARARREMNAAVKLARLQGVNDQEIAQVAGIDLEEFRAGYGRG